MNATVRASVAPESIRRRYAATLLTQFLQLLLSVITAGIVPRALGPAVYGSYNFLLTASATIRGFLEPSAQQAFFTFSSQDERSGPLTKLYGLSLLVQLALIFTIIGFCAAVGVTGWLWPEQRLDQIVWVTLLEWAMFLALAIRQLGDSKGLTVRPQAISAAVSVVTVAGLLGLVAAGRLTFYTYVWVNLLSALVSCVALGYWLLVRHGDVSWTGTFRGRVREYVQRWWRYAAPLLVVEYYMPIVAYLSTYLVQAWYGSVEQGYLALASRWSGLVLVFTSSAVNIVWREIANAMAAADHARAAHVYLRFNRLLFFLALVLCAWLSLSSRTLVTAIAGDRYQAAVPVLMIMAFYPLAQTYGQLNLAALKGAERTKYVRNLGIAFSIPDAALTYLLLAPPTARVPGLGLGALGVALRMVGFGLLSVQAYERASFRLFGLRYMNALAQKLVVTLSIASCGLLALSGLDAVLRTRWSVGALASLTVESLVYFGAVGSLVLLWPSLIGLSRDELRMNIRLLSWRLLPVLSRS